MPSASTPLYGFPYLHGKSNGKDIKTVSKALAEKLEATLQNKGAPPLDSDLVSLLARLATVEDALLNMPDKTASGSVSCPGTGGGVAPMYWSDLVTVVFPPGLFATPPRVVVQTVGPDGSVGFGGAVEQITATGCKVRGVRVNAVPGADFKVHWIATLE